MIAGDLVKVTRASIGVPAGTMGLILSSCGDLDADIHPDAAEKIYFLQLIGTKVVTRNGRRRRYLARDLEVISASR